MKPGASPRGATAPQDLLELPLSIDWEDWYQLCCPPFDAPDASARFEDRLALATHAALDFCRALDARGTWFCLADQAQRHPELLRAIAEAGHEIALHGRTHRRAFEMEPSAFQAQVREGKEILEDLSGQPICGFRAPEWSLRGMAAAYGELLPALGFTYDSSRAPMSVLGDPAWPRRAHWLAPGLAELPPPVLGIGACTIPLWGWALRTFPRGLLRPALRRRARLGTGNPIVLHPWELDEDQPPLPGASRGHRFAHSAGLQGYGPRLQRILAGFRLVPLREWLERHRDRLPRGFLGAMDA